jgi:hypothetical protein
MSSRCQAYSGGELSKAGVEPKQAKAVLAALEDTILGSVNKKGLGEFTPSGLLKINAQEGSKEASLRQGPVHGSRALV